jgi:hypothetical protein
VKLQVVQQMTTLAQAAQIGEPVIGGDTVLMRHCKLHAGQTEVLRVDLVRPVRGTAAPVPPCLRDLIELTAVRQTTDDGQMQAAASLAATAGAFEPHAFTELSPVRRIECSKLRTDWRDPLLGASSAAR